MPRIPAFTASNVQAGSELRAIGHAIGARLERRPNLDRLTTRVTLLARANMAVPFEPSAPNQKR